MVCRYCQNVIHVEMRKPPPQVTPFGMPGGMPSTTLYIDPEQAARMAAQTGRGVAVYVGVMVVLTVFLPLCFTVGPAAVKGCKGKVKPFPIHCALNETVDVSGDFTTTGPIIESANINCKIRIANAKLKGSTLLKSTTSNLDLTLENVTIETTEELVSAGSNFKAHIKGSTLTSKGNVFDAPTNFELDAVASTLQSTDGTIVKSGHNFKLVADNSKFKAKRIAFDTQGLDLKLKKASEITSSDGIAIKTGSIKLEMDGGKIDGSEGAILASSTTQISLKGVSVTAKEKTIVMSNSGHLDAEGGAIASQTAEAIEADTSADMTLDNVRVTAGTNGVIVKNSCKLRVSKKTRITAGSGNAYIATMNSELFASDAILEGGNKAIRAGVNTKVRLQAGAKLTGKRGGLEAEGNLELEGNGSSIEGGAGPGLQSGYNARISFLSGTIKGAPAIVLERRPSSLDLNGTRVEGEQKIPK